MGRGGRDGRGTGEEREWSGVVEGGRERTCVGALGKLVGVMLFVYEFIAASIIPLELCCDAEEEEGNARFLVRGVRGPL